jgi:hypothetical protein
MLSLSKNASPRGATREKRPPTVAVASPPLLRATVLE